MIAPKWNQLSTADQRVIRAIHAVQHDGFPLVTAEQVAIELITADVLERIVALAERGALVISEAVPEEGAPTAYGIDLMTDIRETQPKGKA